MFFSPMYMISSELEPCHLLLRPQPCLFPLDSMSQANVFSNNLAESRGTDCKIKNILDLTQCLVPYVSTSCDISSQVSDSMLIKEFKSTSSRVEGITLCFFSSQVHFTGSICVMNDRVPREDRGPSRVQVTPHEDRGPSGV